MKLYIDGQLQASDTGPTGPRNAAGGIRLGSTLFGGAFFAGAIDDLKIFNYPLTTPGDIWRNFNFQDPANSGTAADLADPDQDGIANLVERGLALDPTVPDAAAALPVMVKDREFFRLTYTRSLSATDLQCQAFWSSDLTNWSSTGITDQLISTQPNRQIREASIPLNNLDPGRGFMRIQVK